MMHPSLALLFALFLVVGATNENEPAAVTPVAFPAVQSSVTSTAFNPALTNAGGTTNSAGTFNVVSLARSSSYAFDTALPQTTSFVIASAPVAPSGNVETPAYFTEGAASTAASNAQDQATQSSVSIPTTGRFTSVVALETGNADSARMETAIQNVWFIALSAAFAVFGAALML